MTRLRSLLSFKLAALHLTASMGRLALTIVAVAVGVSLVVAVQLMNGGVLASFLDTVDGLAGGPGSRSARAQGSPSPSMSSIASPASRGCGSPCPWCGAWHSRTTRAASC